MAARQSDRTARRERDSKPARGVSPNIYLPTADPPRKRPWLLATAAALFAAWLLFLLYLAIQT